MCAVNLINSPTYTAGETVRLEVEGVGPVQGYTCSIAVGNRKTRPKPCKLALSYMCQGWLNILRQFRSCIRQLLMPSGSILLLLRVCDGQFQIVMTGSCSCQSCETVNRSKCRFMRSFNCSSHSLALLVKVHVSVHVCVCTLCWI